MALVTSTNILAGTCDQTIDRLVQSVRQLQIQELVVRDYLLADLDEVTIGEVIDHIGELEVVVQQERQNIKLDCRSKKAFRK